MGAVGAKSALMQTEDGLRAARGFAPCTPSGEIGDCVDAGPRPCRAADERLEQRALRSARCAQRGGIMVRAVWRG
jgi:hypothetical protein